MYQYHSGLWRKRELNGLKLIERMINTKLWQFLDTPKLVIANHWSNEETMEFYITKIIFPYLSETKRKLNIPLDHPALLLFDNFKGQSTEKLLKLLDSHNVDVFLIPLNCTE